MMIMPPTMTNVHRIGFTQLSAGDNGGGTNRVKYEPVPFLARLAIDAAIN
jgi:hypothetical protein